MLYDEVIPNLSNEDDTYILFDSKDDINLFCMGEDVDVRVMNWLIYNLRSEGFITWKFPIRITPLGVKKLCQK